MREIRHGRGKIETDNRGQEGKRKEERDEGGERGKGKKEEEEGERMEEGTEWRPTVHACVQQQGRFQKHTVPRVLERHHPSLGVDLALKWDKRLRTGPPASLNQASWCLRFIL